MDIQTLRDSLDIYHGAPLSVISDCLRGFMIAKPGFEFIDCDFSAVEARGLAWLAGEERVLKVFRTHGKIYEAEASGIYGVKIDDVTSDQRQIGKVSNLALGFGGGVGAFQSMAKNYGVKIPDAQAEDIKVKWRLANPNIVRFWYALEAAAKEAVANPGRQTEVGIHPVKYRVVGSFLLCLLPSGRVLTYPYPKLQEVETPWGEMREAVTYMGEHPKTHKWERLKTYGGHFAENVTQAIARDLLAEALLRLEANNYPVVLHIHDEVVTEVPIGFGSEEEVERIMCELPSWANGLPLSGSAWRGRRFRKD